MSEQNKHIILGLKEKLDEINIERVRRNEKEIKRNDWASFLSGISANSVRQVWITNLTREKPLPISEKKAVTLYSSINALAKIMNLNKLPEDSVTID